MNRNQTEGHANETRDKSENPDDESETVLGEINDDAEKDDAEKHGDKKDTVLGEINDDSGKEKE